jgi:hypothetical protein
MKSYQLILFSLGFVLLLSCNKDDDEVSAAPQPDYIIFGHFAGECFGEECVEIFKLTNTQLLEDTTDNYSAKSLEFVELPANKFNLVNDLNRSFPSELLSLSDSTFGCPDCVDQGGLIVQYAINNSVKTWRIDRLKNNVPVYLHDFMDKINEKIEFINN